MKAGPNTTARYGDNVDDLSLQLFVSRKGGFLQRPKRAYADFNYSEEKKSKKPDIGAGDFAD